MVKELKTYLVYKEEYAKDDPLCKDEIGREFIRVEADSYSEVIRQHPDAERVEFHEKNITWYRTFKSQKIKAFDARFHEILPEIHTSLIKHGLTEDKEKIGIAKKNLREHYIQYSYSKVKLNALLQNFIEEYFSLLPYGKCKLTVFTFPSRAIVTISGIEKQTIESGTDFILLAGKPYILTTCKRGYLLEERTITLTANKLIDVNLTAEPYLKGKKRLPKSWRKKNYIIRLKKDGETNILNVPAQNDIDLFNRLHKSTENLHTYNISWREVKKEEVKK